MQIFNTTVANSMLKNTYITNKLVSFQGLSFIFYKINLFLKYQNKKFK